MNFTQTEGYIYIIIENRELCDGTIITKHDREISQRSNGKRIMSMKVDLKTGDGGGLDMQLSNKVYNQVCSLTPNCDTHNINAMYK